MVFSSRFALLLSVLGAAGCGFTGDDLGTVRPDGGGSMSDAPVATPDARPEIIVDAGPFACLLSAGCPAWFEEYTRQVIASLSGKWPITEGMTLSQRFTDAERAAARAFLADELRAAGLEPRLHRYATGANVYAELPPTGEGGRLIVLGAHFDGVPDAPAAADDGTGVAVVLAAARYLGQLERRDYGVVFVLFDEEERGLLGSTAFADKLRFEDLPVEAVHNFDMISWDGDGDRGVELWSPAPELEQRYRRAGADLGLPIAAFEFGRSDHASFIALGMPAVGVGEQYNQQDSTPHYHQPSDTYDNVDFDYLVSTLQLGLLVIERQLGAAP